MIHKTKLRLIISLMVGVIVITVVGLSVTNTFLARYNPGPAQPIPFSHRIHAGTKDISCVFCHSYASESSNAGIPSMEKCLLCHKVVASNFEPISRIRRYNDRGEGIPWVRVSSLPDFVHFNHQPHITAGHDCGECHGDVKSMDRIKPAHDIDMNFCVTCHQKNNVSVDCYTCHY